MALINVDVTDSEAIEQLKKEYKTLQTATVGYLSLGFVLLLSSPFVIKAKDAPWLRYVSLFCSLYCGATATLNIKRMEEIEPQYTVIKKAETRTFINKSATSEFTLMKLFEREASTILSPPSAPSAAVPPQTTAAPAENYRNDDIEEAAQDSALVAADSGADTDEAPTDTKAERLNLLRQLKKNKRSKAEMIRRLWNIGENNHQYDYYLQMLEEMLAELKRLDGES